MASPAVRFAFEVKSRVLQRGARHVDAKLAENESLSPDELASLQRSASSSMAVHAFDTTRFYRDFYTGAGLTRSDLAVEENFEHLPILEKQHIRDATGSFVSQVTDPARLLPSSTGGSTGEPLTLFHDRAAPLVSLWHRIYRWWGISPADHQGTVYRMKNSGRSNLVRDIKWWPTREIRLDARAMTDDSMQAFLRRWARLRPALLNGYVGGVHELATHILETGIDLPVPHAVAVTAAPLTPSQRATISEAFSAPVHDQYRSAEVPWIAAECAAHDGLHVLADLRTLETVDTADHVVPVGVDGNIILTDLTNRAFPLIRYRIGDRTTRLDGVCACGNTLPRIAGVTGRRSDVILTPEGLRITGGLTGLFNGTPHAVRQFQIYQHADYSVSLRYVLTDAPDAPRHVEKARSEVQRLLRNAVPVTSERVQKIEHDRGKARIVVSEVAPPQNLSGTDSPDRASLSPLLDEGSR